MKSLKMKNIEYNEDAISELEMALKEEKNIRTYKRISVVLKHFHDFTNRVISEMDGVEVHSVGKYIKTYKDKELDALTAKKSTGAPRKLSPEQEN